MKNGSFSRGDAEFAEKYNMVFQFQIKDEIKAARIEAPRRTGSTLRSRRRANEESALIWNWYYVNWSLHQSSNDSFDELPVFFSASSASPRATVFYRFSLCYPSNPAQTDAVRSHLPLERPDSPLPPLLRPSNPFSLREKGFAAKQKLILIGHSKTTCYSAACCVGI